jgi:hypothetical protein
MSSFLNRLRSIVPSSFSQSVTYTAITILIPSNDNIGSPTSPDDKELLTQNFDNENTLANDITKSSTAAVRGCDAGSGEDDNDNNCYCTNGVGIGAPVGANIHDGPSDGAYDGDGPGDDICNGKDDLFADFDTTGYRHWHWGRRWQTIQKKKT